MFHQQRFRDRGGSTNVRDGSRDRPEPPAIKFRDRGRPANVELGTASNQRRIEDRLEEHQSSISLSDRVY